MCYALYFYFQSISPDCIKGLVPDEVLSFAFVSLYCFLPACILCAYASLYILLPVFLRKQSYAGLVLGFAVLFAVSLFINYFASVLFLEISTHGHADHIIFMRIFSLGFNNSQNAMIIAGLAPGIKLTRIWWLQKKENLLLARQTTRTRLGLLKVKIHPDFLFRSLNDITDHIKTGSPASAGMIINLSDLLSYLLYDAEEETVPLANELSILQKFLNLELARRGSMLRMDTTITGNPQNQQIPPMILLPFLQAVFETAWPGAETPLTADLYIFSAQYGLSFQFTVHSPACTDRSFIGRSETLQTVRNRLGHFFPGCYTLDIAETREQIVVTLDILSKNKSPKTEDRSPNQQKQPGYEFA